MCNSFFTRKDGLTGSIPSASDTWEKNMGRGKKIKKHGKGKNNFKRGFSRLRGWKTSPNPAAPGAAAGRRQSGRDGPGAGGERERQRAGKGAGGEPRRGGSRSAPPPQQGPAERENFRKLTLIPLVTLSGIFRKAGLCLRRSGIPLFPLNPALI